MKHLLAIALIAFPVFSHAECWLVSGLNGLSARERGTGGYLLSKDGFSGRTFEINFDSQNSSVTPSNMKCQNTSSRSLLCIDVRDEKVTVETWVVNPALSEAFHTKSISGYGPYDGGNLYIGKVIGKCKPR